MSSPTSPDVVELTQDLIRLDTSNPPGHERAAIEHLAGVLADAGIPSSMFALDPARPNLIAHVPGRGTAPGLLLHGHVDVVPTAGQTWRHPPFSAAVIDGELWGRGALDMKSALAQMAVAFITAATAESAPAGDLVFAAFSDEEAGSEYGARFMIEQHAELFDDVQYALGELGGISTHIAGHRFYPIQVSEKQWCVLRLTVRGRSGHGSVPVRGEAMARLGELLTRLDGDRLPVHLTAITRQTFAGIADSLDAQHALPFQTLLDPARADGVLEQGGRAMGLFDAALHNTVTPTMLSGSPRVDAIPGAVTVDLDGRILPGFAPVDLVNELQELCGPDVEIEVIETHPPARSDPDMSLFPTMQAALRDVDPYAVAVPLLLPGVTDGRFLSQLGIQCYGYTPLRLPPGFPLGELIHSANERIPVDALRFGAAVLTRMLQRYGRPLAETAVGPASSTTQHRAHA